MKIIKISALKKLQVNLAFLRYIITAEVELNGLINVYVCSVLTIFKSFYFYISPRGSLAKKSFYTTDQRKILVYIY